MAAVVQVDLHVDVVDRYLLRRDALSAQGFRSLETALAPGVGVHDDADPGLDLRLGRGLQHFLLARLDHGAGSDLTDHAGADQGGIHAATQVVQDLLADLSHRSEGHVCRVGVGRIVAAAGDDVHAGGA